ncbi:hypothetical protein GCM10011369_30290 [Neiella marina]|uniref:Ice-binding protein C-terminal domain-containing protein n=1 Tax=Neiella marina TaxID=508461 RepID=A0A8J2U8S9_9GAMM|nr:PEP-CTERM sorting domain-containing protein [Neiella marina]GGA86175.1 hypothetical protein GCM10011369_30290 [Neiella marina]
MFSNLHCGRLLQGAALTTGLLLSSSACAGLINVGFDTGMADFGWNGVVADGFGGEFPVDVLSSDVFSFDSAAGSATIMATDFWAGGYLFQTFAVDADYDQLSLAYDFATSADYEPVNIGLWSGGALLHDFLDPSDGLSFDFSRLNVNDLVELRFGFEDWDFNYFNDYLTVSDIAISTKTAAAVPEPSSVALFSLALLALGHRSLSRRTTTTLVAAK